MEDALRRVTLRKVEISQDSSSSASSGLVSAVEAELEQNKKLRSVDLESWYPFLEKYTFRTVFVPISPEEARTIVAEYSRRKRDNFSSYGPILSSALVELKQKLDRALTSLGSQYIFAKLSSRSPKDSKFCQDRAFKLVCDSLIAQRAAGVSTVSLHQILKTVMRTSIQCLRLESSEAILDCFCSSDRVCEDDIPLALSFANREWNQHIVLREWVDIPTEAEFRAFVFNGKLCGVSQYFTGALFPEIVANREKILTMIENLFNNIKDKIPVVPADYVLDLAIDFERDRSYVIELNPFGKPDGLGTGLCLFNRKNAQDLAVLFGEAPFQFRMETTEPVLSAAQMLRNGELRDFLIGEKFLSQ